MLCPGCYGSGKILGGGMIQKSHDLCNGTGKIVDPEADLMERHPGLTKTQASSIIADALQEINSDKDKHKPKNKPKRKPMVQQVVLQVGA